MICQTVRKVFTMRQQHNKPLAEYYKRFTSCVDVAESQWGTLVLTAAATNETIEKTSRDKSITCVFLAGVDTKKYGRLKTELNNAYVAGQNNYPKTVESSVTMLSHYMKDKGVHMTSALAASTQTAPTSKNQTSFAKPFGASTMECSTSAFAMDTATTDGRQLLPLLSKKTLATHAFIAFESSIYTKIVTTFYLVSPITTPSTVPNTPTHSTKATMDHTHAGLLLTQLALKCYKQNTAPLLNFPTSSSAMTQLPASNKSFSPCSAPSSAAPTAFPMKPLAFKPTCSKMQSTTSKLS
jgi:hypothetical protein